MNLITVQGSNQPERKTVRSISSNRSVNVWKDGFVEDLSFSDLKYALFRNWVIVASFIALSILIAAAYTAYAPITYRAHATIEVLDDQGTSFDFDNIDIQALPQKNFKETQLGILLSSTVLGATIDKMGLDDHKDLGGSGASLPDRMHKRLIGLISPESEDKLEPANMEEHKRQSQIQNLRSRLWVNPRQNSDLVDLYYTSTDRYVAADLLNTLVNEFQSHTLKRQIDKTKTAREFLSTEIDVSRRNLAQLEAQLSDLAKDNGLVDVGDATSILTDRLQALSAEQAALEVEFNESQAQFDAVSRHDPESLDSIVTNFAIGQLKKERASLAGEVSALSEHFLPEYPKLRELQSQLAEVDKRIATEIGKVVQNITTNHFIVTQKLDGLKQQIQAYEKDYFYLREKSLGYQLGKRELSSHKTLHDDLIERMKELSVASGLESDYVLLIDPALVPQIPHSPKLKRNLILAVPAGVFSGVLFAVFFGLLNSRVTASTDLEKITMLPNFGVVPKLDRYEGKRPLNADWALLQQPEGIFSESIRNLRTNLVRHSSEESLRVIQVTSSAPYEGKSTIAINLAVSLASMGKRVVLVDADFRHPRCSIAFSVSDRAGISDWLCNGKSGHVLRTKVKNLMLFPAGLSTNEATDSLGAPSLRRLFAYLESNVDFVIVDTPPCLGFSDASAISSSVDAVLYVVDSERTHPSHVKYGLKRLESAKAPLFATVMNRAASFSPDCEVLYQYRKYYRNGARRERSLLRRA